MFDEVLRIETNWPSETVKNVDGFATLLPHNEKPEETFFTQAVPSMKPTMTQWEALSN